MGDVVEVEDEWGAGAVEFADGVTTSGVHHPHRRERGEAIGEITRHISQQMSVPEHVEAHRAVSAQRCDDGVGDGLSGDEVEVGGVGDGAAWVDGDVAAVVACLSVDDGDVHRHCRR